jgi:hypothetical protein
MFYKNDKYIYIVCIFVFLLSVSNKNNPLNKLDSYSRMRINTHSRIIKTFSKDLKTMGFLCEKQKFNTIKNF